MNMQYALDHFYNPFFSISYTYLLVLSLLQILHTVFPHIVSTLEQFPPLNSFRIFMYCDQRSQYIRQKSKKNSFCGNYMRKYSIPYFRKQFPRKLFFFEFNLMYCDLWLQYIQVRKLFKGGNYSRAETIRRNTAIQLKQIDFCFLRLP